MISLSFDPYASVESSPESDQLMSVSTHEEGSGQPVWFLQSKALQVILDGSTDEQIRCR